MAIVAAIIQRATLTIRRLEQQLLFAFSLGRFPPESFCIASVNATEKLMVNQQNEKFSLKDLIGDGLLWAVPKTRRTIEKRLKRKFGVPGYNLKILLPKKNLRTCNTCGSYYEVGILCPNCYNRVREETLQMQEIIQKELGLNPVDKDVVVLYDGEKNLQPAEFWKGKRIVEMQKPRPQWFSKNLLQQSTQEPAETKDVVDVKPTQLG